MGCRAESSAPETSPATARGAALRPSTGAEATDPPRDAGRMERMRLRLCSRGKDEDEPVPRSHGQRRGGHRLRADERLCRQPARPRVGRSGFRAVVDGRQRPGRAHDDRRSRLSSDPETLAAHCLQSLLARLSRAVSEVAALPQPGYLSVLHRVRDLARLELRDEARDEPTSSWRCFPPGNAGQLRRRPLKMRHAGVDCDLPGEQVELARLASARSTQTVTPQPGPVERGVQPPPHHRGGRRTETPSRRRRSHQPTIVQSRRCRR